jgi:hypothetical protein
VMSVVGASLFNCFPLSLYVPPILLSISCWESVFKEQSLSLTSLCVNAIFPLPQKLKTTYFMEVSDVGQYIWNLWQSITLFTDFL